MKKTIFFLLFFVSACCMAQDEKEAEGVIRRFAGREIPMHLALSLKPVDGCDQFATSVKNGKLTIKGSSGVALCRGFYEYVRQHKTGLCTWTGKRLSLPQRLDDQSTTRKVSPYKHHYYLNVVTYGYTAPYWDWSRWQEEIDWMALHGIDMPLMLVANEAIYTRVLKRMGMNEADINAYFVGPAHLPWMRMGNISGIDGPLTASWHSNQIALAHKILARMRALGMKPICPAFAGFVPQALQKLYPKARITETSWSGGAFHNWMLSADEPLFHAMGKLFVEEWEKEFGKNTYYLADSFNEMQLPFGKGEDNEKHRMLADYGQKIYSAIADANPRAVWVIQGWMFGYQRDIWDDASMQALLSKVPDNRMLILDMAEDYNHHYWRNGANWDFFNGFHNKPWVYSVIPNMGGKTAYTGVLEFYANGRLKALRSPHKGNLVGYGMAPEGLENNEVIYELVADGGWTAGPIDLNTWLADYSECRYGRPCSRLGDYWRGMLASVYGSFTDHPRYNWQLRPGSNVKGTVCFNDSLFAGIEAFAAAAPELNASALYQADLIELTALYAGAKMEILTRQIARPYREGHTSQAEALQRTFTRVALTTDSLLDSHPTLRMDRWIAYARKAAGADSTLAAQYERNARRIVTVWGPPVDDYSARIWSGLIRSYYLPRWQHYFESLRTKQPFDFKTFELQWVASTHNLGARRPVKDVTATCRRLINECKEIKEPESR
ncbi:alpha-N-acetylglucosaminidase [Prevotella sp. kh1p2]|uniref:alpha-N-acetylglucosaminidase n=1 Tax=Prevotella sp. kh1p2 TaxID=1761883 RepID=UPI0008C3B250|nr:alpha-N-acetylglucosaminidase [Prevotella sp. kh1p2]SES85686.1 alpha-N-acetylglucosaminidase [Prevotella sp. kh1p2]SNU11052.1 alpha-N-acetylglucosaminidase [Prevotellaceae bacterium KH2P17]